MSCGFCSGLDKLMLTTQQAKLKQLKKIQLLKSQVHQSASLVAQRQEKEEHEQIRANEVEARIQQLKAERMAREADVEVGWQTTSTVLLCTPHLFHAQQVTAMPCTRLCRWSAPLGLA